ncbi:hypothetical protein [Mycobacterium sp. 050134]|uniref:hypothetical protein n=1 Tax=Mycobacterium sp. 050134 TaxID=3096111 RepID=UPI002EDAF87A
MADIVSRPGAVARRSALALDAVNFLLADVRDGLGPGWRCRRRRRPATRGRDQHHTFASYP